MKDHPMEIRRRHLISEADRMVLKFAHLMEKHMDNKLVGLRQRYMEIREPSLKADIINEIRAVGMVKASIASAREEFTSDSVNFHAKRLEERLALVKNRKRAVT